MAKSVKWFAKYCSSSLIYIHSLIYLLIKNILSAYYVNTRNDLEDQVAQLSLYPLALLYS